VSNSLEFRTQSCAKNTKLAALNSSIIYEAAIGFDLERAPQKRGVNSVIRYVSSATTFTCRLARSAVVNAFLKEQPASASA
jgi:hypothetical protein